MADGTYFIKLRENIKVHFRLYFALRHCVVLLVVTKVEEQHAASIFRVEVNRERMRSADGRLFHRAQTLSALHTRLWRTAKHLNLSYFGTSSLKGRGGQTTRQCKACCKHRLLFSHDEPRTTVIMTTKWSSSFSGDRSPIMTYCIIFFNS
jgi:hypothetical protein